MLYKEYDKETLQKLQNIELELLRDFVTLCEKYDIDYFGVGGTAIGAVRHKGIIPWDDDIDIAFTRNNYEKFLEVADKEYGDKYRIVNAETTPGYPLMSTRWCVRGSKFKEECFRNLDLDLGIFLDLYYFDAVPDDEKAMKRQGWRAWFWSKMLILRAIGEPVLYFDGFKAKIVIFGCKIVHALMVLFHVSYKFLYCRAKKSAMKYNGTETKRIGWYFDPSPFLSIVNREDIEPTKYMEFNGIQVKFPGKVEKYLERRYGDYMTVPPEDKRHNHPPYELQFPEES